MDHRRSLLDGDATPTHERENVFGDEFEVDEWDLVADGFRPMESAPATQHGGARQDAVTEEDDDEHPPIRSVSAHYAAGISDSAMGSASNRNSTRKSRTSVNPFASPEDAEGATEQRHSLEFEPETNFAHRTLSSASSRVYARTESPRFGAGPSHPYGMYTQGTVPRSPSVTTAASTIRQPSQRQSYSQSRPQHPYAMYPQGVVLDDDLDDADDQILPNPVPVGFPGLGQNYTRRIGPDGEDQGIVDEDGHTEQLPPYSRYPEDGPEKMPLLPPTLHSRAPVAGTDPGMALMHDTLLPVQTAAPTQSMTDASALARHSTAHSLVRMMSSSSEGTLAKSWQSKSWKEKSWKEKRKTKFCGVPFWWILLTICVITFIAAVLGGVIGSFMAGGPPKHSSNATVTTTLLYDASLMPSPTSGAPPMGTFSINLGPPEEVQSDCLLDDDDVSSAWDCNLAPNSKMGLIVQDIIGDGQGSGATLFYNSNDQEISAGAQLSYMKTRFSPFLTVTDNDDKDNGLAFYFQDFYDKIVVVPEGSINLHNNKRVKRDAYAQPPFVVPAAWRSRKEVLVPGAKPWFCVWNETFVEGFVYINEPSVMSTSSSTSSSTPPPSSSSTESSASSTTSQTTSGPPSPTPPMPSTTSTSDSPTDIITKTVTDTATTAVYTGPAQKFQDWVNGEQWKASRHEYETGPIYKRQAPGDWAALPYVVKIEERRLPNSPQPYCQQYQILDDGRAGVVTDSNGPIIVNLNEQDPTFGAYESAGTASTARRKRGASSMANACHCQWMSGEEDAS